MEMERAFHNWIISHLKQRLSREYQEIAVNAEGEENKEFHGHYPDMILGSHGIVVSIVEVETDTSITPEKVNEWKELSRLGVKLTIMIPEKSRAKVMNLLWDEGIAQEVAIGSYDLKIVMP